MNGVMILGIKFDNLLMIKTKVYLKKSSRVRLDLKNKNNLKTFKNLLLIKIQVINKTTPRIKHQMNNNHRVVS
jgi:hypothetical protein